MKFTLLIIGAAVADSALAHPGMKGVLADIRAAAALDKRAPAPELIGDLLTQGNTTAVGTLVQDCLLNGRGCVDTTPKTYKPPSFLGSAACRQDTCCVWDFIARELKNYFTHNNGRCNQHARAAIRLGFHDAGPWSRTSGSGGADGSILLSDDEIKRPVNRGLESIRNKANNLFRQYSKYGPISAADLVQFMANVATVVCPLGPRVRTLVGRVDSKAANPDGLMPNPSHGAAELIQIFGDKTFSPNDLVALVGAHTASNQFFFNQSRAGAPLDSTPGVWDVTFYGEVLNDSPPRKVFKFPSDISLSQDPATTNLWNRFADPDGGQGAWNFFYARAYVRLSLMGVQNINQLNDCTKVLPDEITDFRPRDDESDFEGQDAGVV